MTRHTDTRLTARQRGYDTRWDKARAAYLIRHPLCVMCQRQGRVEPATVVDHVEPHRLGHAIESGDQAAIAAARARFWSSDNWQALCAHCHDSTKQRIERSRVTGCDADGWPVDGSHHWHKE